jgi:hypothetical protein
MSGNAQDCRRQAQECWRLARQATSHRSREDYTALANTWLQLAIIFETDDALFEARSNVVRFAKRRRPIRLKRSTQV